MKIVLVADVCTDDENLGLSTAFFRIPNYVKALEKLGHRVNVIASGKQIQGEFEVPSRPLRLLKLVTGYSIMRGKYDETVVRTAMENAEIVHYLLPFHLSIGVKKIADELEVPSLASFTCIPEDVLSHMRFAPSFLAPKLYRRWRRHFYKHIVHIHCSTGLIAEQLKKYGYTSRLHIIGNGNLEKHIGEKMPEALQDIAEADLKEMIALYEEIIKEKKRECEAPDAHKIHLPQTKVLTFDENFAFVNRNVFFVLFASLFKFVIIYPIFFSITKCFLGFKAEGRKYLREVKTGAVTVSNHVHILDAPMLGFSLFPRQPVMTSLKGNFETPGIHFLVRTLGAAPIPETTKALGAFMRAMAAELKRGRLVHFYPEAALWPGYTELRPFKNGAFHLAVMTGKPVLPIVLKTRDPKGLFRLFKKKPCITVLIGSLIAVPTTGSKREQINMLRESVHNAMQAMLAGGDPVVPSSNTGTKKLETR